MFTRSILKIFPFCDHPPDDGCCGISDCPNRSGSGQRQLRWRHTHLLDAEPLAEKRIFPATNIIRIAQIQRLLQMRLRH